MKWVILSRGDGQEKAPQFLNFLPKYSQRGPPLGPSLRLHIKSLANGPKSARATSELALHLPLPNVDELSRDVGGTSLTVVKNKVRNLHISSTAYNFLSSATANFLNG